jgi:hypothetical protein
MVSAYLLCLRHGRCIAECYYGSQHLLLLPVVAITNIQSYVTWRMLRKTHKVGSNTYATLAPDAHRSPSWKRVTVTINTARYVFPRIKRSCGSICDFLVETLCLQ